MGDSSDPFDPIPEGFRFGAVIKSRDPILRGLLLGLSGEILKVLKRMFKVAFVITGRIVPNLRRAMLANLLLFLRSLLVYQ